MRRELYLKSWPQPHCCRSGRGRKLHVTGDDEDNDAFREAMRDVRPLPDAVRTAPIDKPKPAPKARFMRADQREVLKESLLPPSDEAQLATGDELSFRRPHIPEDVLLQLRRGRYSVDAEIDLHGMTAAEAKAALRSFFGSAVASSHGCVRVIHGKGRGSGPRGPVLKNTVNHWLQREEHVLAFGSARAIDGGSGAVYVLLKTVKR
jgi:DNA-nicking Smr family endonuclease